MARAPQSEAAGASDSGLSPLYPSLHAATMAAMTEFELIDRFFRRRADAGAEKRGTALGIGDDAALLSPTPGHQLAASVDMLVAGRHFFADVDPEALGHKTLAVNLSDMAAMGATPRWALLAGALPDPNAQWLDGFARGFFALAATYGVDLVGGDTTRGPLNLCVTILGEVPAGKAILRSGARAGDSIWISGALGHAALALAHLAGRVSLSPGDEAACRGALLRPVPRVELGLRLRDLASSAIDISDGLVGDLGHVLDASRVGASLDLDAIPRSTTLDGQLDGPAREIALQCLLAGGDDYELCFTAAPAHDTRVAAIARELGLALHRVGAVTAEPGLVVRDASGRPLAELPRAYDHFAA
jgi:thiamine-monophosphate kinase